jgi:hypothetical protein
MNTVFAFVGLFVLHSLVFLALINKMTIIPSGKDYGVLESRIYIGIFVIFLYSLFYFLLKKIDITNLNYTDSKIKKGNIYLVAYIALLLISFLAIAIIQHG